MMVPDDVGMTAFQGDAGRKATLLERLRWYESLGDAELKMALLQEKVSERAQSGLVLNPYPKIVRRQDIAGLRISGDVATLYALGTVNRSALYLFGDNGNRSIYLVRYDSDKDFSTLLGVPPPLVSVFKSISKGLTP